MESVSASIRAAFIMAVPGYFLPVSEVVWVVTSLGFFGFRSRV